MWMVYPCDLAYFFIDYVNELMIVFVVRILNNISSLLRGSVKACLAEGEGERIV